MSEYMDNQQLEVDYLQETVSVIKNKIEDEENKLVKRKKDLIDARREMYENTAHSSNDFDKLTEMVQHLSPIEVQTYDYVAAEQRLEKYKRLLSCPYFARIDFAEEGYEEESIYIGIGNLIEDSSYKTYVYDWRAPISSIFYRYEIGKASYVCPSGVIEGNVSLKRQYEIKNSKLQYFFDSNVTIMDDILKKVLSSNASSKMKSIVETIQKEQDIIIRDIENDLVIVQGVAGSGKTSVALHRVAFLMYQSLTTKIGVNNIVLISPNSLFGEYISHVLPELGEKNVTTITFEDLFESVFDSDISIKSRNSLLENIINSNNEKSKSILKSSLEFKLSKSFMTIIDRYIHHFEHSMIDFTDIFFAGECIADRHLLKSELLVKQKSYMPVEKRLNQIEVKLSTKLHELRKVRLIKLEKFVAEHTNHPFNVKSFARLLSIKQSLALLKTIHKFTRIDYLSLYKKLFRDKELFYRLSEGLSLPSNISEILDYTNEILYTNDLTYDDGIALMWLKIKMSGCSTYYDIKQVVVDEAQDYYPVHYEILKTLFKNSKYTVLGDFNQTIEKNSDLSIYDDIKGILNKKKSTSVFMNKSFRCSYEISKYSEQFIDSDMVIESFNRHGTPPKEIIKSNIEELDNSLVEDIIECQNLDYSSIAILCNSMKKAEALYNRISSKVDVKLISESTDDTMLGMFIVPIYMAKGLEFDAVLVYDMYDRKHLTKDNKRLMYIASTRALHYLSVYFKD